MFEITCSAIFERPPTIQPPHEDQRHKDEAEETAVGLYLCQISLYFGLNGGKSSIFKAQMNAGQGSMAAPLLLGATEGHTTPGTYSNHPNHIF